ETLKLFISYSRRDSSAADSLAAAFVTRGFDVRIDRRDLPFGEKWQAELADLIRASDTIVWLISERSVASEWCKWELKQALQLNKRIIPVATQQVDANALPEGIASIQIL